MAIKAFPTAEGYGKYAVGGRGGTVYKITNLNDSGPGSLREACEASGPRTVIFEVAGTINLQSKIQINNDYITIAGHTSFGDGVMLTLGNTNNEPLMRINANHIIIRYLKFRHNPIFPTDGSRDNLHIESGENMIIDHCSMAFAPDGNLDITTGAYGSPDYADNGDTKNITIQYCLLFQPTDVSKNSLNVGGITNITWFRNAYIYGNQRNVAISSSSGYRGEPTYFENINNITFRGKWANTIAVGFDSGIPPEDQTYNINYINNYHMMEAGSRRPVTVESSDTSSDIDIYLKGCLSSFWRTSITTPTDWEEEWSITQGTAGSTYAGDIPQGYVDGTDGIWYRAPSEMQMFVPHDTPIVTDNVPLYDAEDIWPNIRSHVGASLPNRDSTDEFAVNLVDVFLVDLDRTAIIDNPAYDTKTGSSENTLPNLDTTGSPETDTSNDGMPDSWKTSKGLDPNTDDSSYIWPSGYVGPEVYINELAGDIQINAPVIVRTDNNPTTIEVGGVYLPPTGTWTDVEDGSGTATVGGDTVDVNTIGIYNVTLEHTDTDGNRGFINIPITIVTEIVNAQGVVVTPESTSVSENNTVSLSVAFVPSNTTDQSGVWSSSNESIATVDTNGDVTGVLEGSAVITFTSNDGGFTDTCNITVTEALSPESPVLTSAYKSGSDYILTFTQGGLQPEGGWDTFIDNVDQSDNASHVGFSRTITGLDTNVDHTFKLEARYTQLNPAQFLESNEITVFFVGNPPVITLIGDPVINLNVGDTYIEQGATATDVEDGDISQNIIITGTVDTNTIGTYIREYNITDSDSNEAITITRTINVSQGNTRYALNADEKVSNKKIIKLLKRVNL